MRFSSNAMRIMAASMWLACEAPAQTTYTVTDLGTLGGPMSRAFAVNNSGIIVGSSSASAAPDVRRGFRWEAGVMIDLGDLGGPSSEAFDINDVGEITGYAETEDSIQFNEITHAFRWHNGVMDDLGTNGGDSSRGWAINASGVVAGVSQVCLPDPKMPKEPCIPVGNEYAARWDGAQVQGLGGLFGSSDSSAFGMNASGHIVGQSHTVVGFNQPRHAVRWEGTQIFDLGTLGGFNSWAMDINDDDIITGFSDNPQNNAHHTFRYNIREGQMIDLGVPPGYISSLAQAINNAGHIVGEALSCCNVAAFLYDGEMMIDLNERIPADSGWELTFAADINDAGWIVGVGLHNGVERGFLLTPVSDCPADTNGSGTVDVDDLVAVILDWGCTTPPGPCPTDVDESGVVDVDDLIVVILSWGVCAR